MLHPTTRRLNRSCTAARYTHPSRVGMYVTSATQVAFGSVGSNWRSSTLSATGREWFESVVRTNRRFTAAEMPARFISLATEFTQHASPRATSSACIRGLPYRPFTWRWIARTRSVNSSRRCSPALGGRFRQA